MTIKITLPLPHKHLSPNARVHWRAKADAKKKARSDSMWATLAVLRQEPNSEPYLEKATVQATFYVKDRRSLADPDNALSSIKAQIDGLKDARLIADDSGLTHLPVKFEIDKKNPRLEIEVTNAE